MTTRTIKAGTTDVSVVIRIVDSGDGTPETGVVFNTGGIDLEYRRELAASVDITEATLAALTTAHADGGFLHIGNGYYRLDLPDAACAAGVTGVLVHGVVTGMVVIGCYIELVAYDPYDTIRLGLTALPNAAADAAGGLPISDAGGLDLDTQIGTDIDAILVDTGTTLQAELDAIQAAVITNAAGTDIAADIIALKAETAAILVDTGTTLQAELDAIEAAVITNAAGVDIAADIIAIKAETAAIVADTNELQTDDYPTSIAAVKSDTAAILVDTADMQPKIGTPAASLSADILVIDNLVDDLETRLTALRAGYLDNLSAGAAALEATAQAVKAKTDSLTFTVANKVDANMTAIDANPTSNNTAELKLKKLEAINSAGDAALFRSTGSNGRGLGVEGHGSGSGSESLGGDTGAGRIDRGGATSGIGYRAHAQAGNNDGGQYLGSGTGNALNTVGGSTSGAGLKVSGGGTGPGFQANKGGTGTKDIDADELDSILADTNELQTDWVNGGRLDLILDIIAQDTTTDIPTLINALNNLSSAQAQTAAAAALTAYDPPTRTEATADKDEILTQLPAAPVKNAAFTYVIKMVDSTDHATPETGLTITMTRSIDGAAFGAATGVVTEISTGHYKVVASAADMNGDVVTHKFAASGADDLTIVMKTVS